jgi:hypothetical protein
MDIDDRQNKHLIMDDLESQTKKRYKKEEEECCNNCKLCICLILCFIAAFYLVSIICVIIYVFCIEDKNR